MHGGGGSKKSGARPRVYKGGAAFPPSCMCHNYNGLYDILFRMTKVMEMKSNIMKLMVQCPQVNHHLLLPLREFMTCNENFYVCHLCLLTTASAIAIITLCNTNHHFCA